MKQIIIEDKDLIEELCLFGLRDMERRTGHVFPLKIENIIIDTFQEVGLDLSNGLKSLFDNLYVNGQWGFISSKDKSIDRNDCVIYDEDKDVYVKELYVIN